MKTWQAVRNKLQLAYVSIWATCRTAHNKEFKTTSRFYGGTVSVRLVLSIEVYMYYVKADAISA